MRLTAVAQALQATATRLGIAMGVEVHAIGMAYEVGQFLLHLRKRDPMTVDDGAGVLGELFVSFMKTKVDEATIAEDLAYSFYKDLRDVAQLTDAQIRDFFKVLVDSAVVSDGHWMSLSKPLIDLVTNAEDYAYLLTKKVKEDVVDLADVIDSRDMIKGLADPASASESYASALHKPLVDGSSVSDTDRYEFIKTLFDRVTVTDDFDGAASIQDDQEMQFTKSVTDVVGFTDVIYVLIVVVRDFLDQATVSDHFASNMAKAITELEAMAQDLVYLGFNKAPADTSAAWDYQIRSIAKKIHDNPQISDAKAFALARMTTESTQVSDTGLVRSQSYASDSFYFAEDYVGTSRTF
ncbi:MAG: hypothetical protein E6R03_16845 [Hyphomicrobiaceae bacterium]|nr:MAG: hypothetical protein E6R03_16845 [Hyphomicrobiaceae bacterium]